MRTYDQLKDLYCIYSNNVLKLFMLLNWIQEESHNIKHMGDGKTVFSGQQMQEDRFVAYKNRFYRNMEEIKPCGTKKTPSGEVPDLRQIMMHINL